MPFVERDPLRMRLREVEQEIRERVELVCKSPPPEDLDTGAMIRFEEDLSIADLVARGHDEELVRRVTRMIDRNEYKRRQAPPGVKLRPKAFGRDRRTPITNRFAG